MSGRTFSLIEVAGLLGVDRGTVYKWLQSGCPYVEKPVTKRGEGWKLDLAEVVRWREKRAAENAAGGSKIDVDEAKRRKIAAEAALAELELAERRGEVVAIEDVVAVVSDQFTACRARLLSVAHKTGPLVAPVTDIVECVNLIDRAIREALDELAGYDGRGEGVISGGVGEGADYGEAGAYEAAAETDGFGMGGQVSAAIGGSERGAGSMDNGA